jgi:YebC/PmpR family DNA-binding regulatory protein
MAGHSHAANIAHRKGLVDAKRGKLFSKLCRQIYVAARAGGADPTSNLRLRYAIDKARAVSCPKENIERSIKKATGELGAENYEEIIYEGYGPSGVAVMCEILTDNRNRTASEVRKIFELCGGSLGSTGCVSYLFSYKGFFLVPKVSIAEDLLMETALEAGADDIVTGDEYYEITCEPKAFDDLRKTLEDKRIVTEVAEMRHLPSNTVELDADSARKMIRLRDMLDENDDVQNVFANEIIPDSILSEDS